MIETKILNGRPVWRSCCELCKVRGAWLSKREDVERNMRLHERSMHQVAA